MTKLRAAPLCLMDRHLVGIMLPRMGIALAVTMAALVIERLLRLFDFVTGQGAAIRPVLAMALNLLPHYLGLALPAAFCIAVLGALARLSEENEIDALEGAGWSLRRIGAPFLACGAMFAVVSLALFGFVQPYSRYAYDEIRNQVLTAGWNGRIEEGVFLDVGEGMVLSAATIDASGQVLHRIFLLRDEDGRRTATTARRGVIVPDPARGTVHLVLKDGRSLLPDGQTLEFESLTIGRDFSAARDLFRPRGGSARELTLIELWARMHPPGAAASAAGATPDTTANGAMAGGGLAASGPARAGAAVTDSTMGAGGEDPSATASGTPAPEVAERAHASSLLPRDTSAGAPAFDGAARGAKAGATDRAAPDPVSGVADRATPESVSGAADRAAPEPVSGAADRAAPGAQASAQDGATPGAGTSPAAPVSATTGFAVEFHDRLVRAVSLLGVALLSVPLGVTRKRSPGWPRIVIAIAVLALFDNLIKFVSGMGKLGQIDPALGLWGLALVFNLGALWLFLATPGQGARGPVRLVLRGLERWAKDRRPRTGSRPDPRTEAARQGLAAARVRR